MGAHTCSPLNLRISRWRFCLASAHVIPLCAGLRSGVEDKGPIVLAPVYQRWLQCAVVYPHRQHSLFSAPPLHRAVARHAPVPSPARELTTTSLPSMHRHIPLAHRPQPLPARSTGLQEMHASFSSHDASRGAASFVRAPIPGRDGVNGAYFPRSSVSSSNTAGHDHGSRTSAAPAPITRPSRLPTDARHGPLPSSGVTFVPVGITGRNGVVASYYPRSQGSSSRSSLGAPPHGDQNSDHNAHTMTVDAGEYPARNRKTCAHRSSFTQVRLLYARWSRPVR